MGLALPPHPLTPLSSPWDKILSVTVSSRPMFVSNGLRRSHRCQLYTQYHQLYRVHKGTSSLPPVRQGPNQKFREGQAVAIADGRPWRGSRHTGKTLDAVCHRSRSVSSPGANATQSCCVLSEWANLVLSPSMIPSQQQILRVNEKC